MQRKCSHRPCPAIRLITPGLAVEVEEAKEEELSEVVAVEVALQRLGWSRPAAAVKVGRRVLKRERSASDVHGTVVQAAESRRSRQQCPVQASARDAFDPTAYYYLGQTLPPAWSDLHGMSVSTLGSAPSAGWSQGHC